MADGDAAFNETASEDAIPTLIQMHPVPNGIAGIIGCVGHHDYHGIALSRIESLNDSGPITANAVVPNDAKRRVLAGEFLHDGPRAIQASVVHHDNFMWNPVQLQFQMNILGGLGNARRLVPGWNHNAEKIQFGVHEPLQMISTGHVLLYQIV